MYVVVNDPKVFITFMEKLVAQEKSGLTTNKALKLLGKDLKTVKRFLPVYRLHKRNNRSYSKVCLNCNNIIALSCDFGLSQKIDRRKEITQLNYCINFFIGS